MAALSRKSAQWIFPREGSPLDHDGCAHGEFTRETITKLFYCKRLDAYATVPGTSLCKVVVLGFNPGNRAANSDVVLPLSITSN
jgi:hypothetical protein